MTTPAHLRTEPKTTMNTTSAFQDGLTITTLDGTTTVTGKITHLSPRRLEITLAHPYRWLFHLERPVYFSRFLLGDGFLGPEGEPFAHRMHLKLHRAALYLEKELPRVAEALAEDENRYLHFMQHMDPLLEPDTMACERTFREAVLRIEAKLTPVGATRWPMLRWQHPFLSELLELQANVLLHQWLSKGPIDLRSIPTGPLEPTAARPLPYKLH